MIPLQNVTAAVSAIRSATAVWGAALSLMALVCYPCSSVADSVQAVAAPVQPVQLTHRYSFNDGTANDSVGGVHGTLVNGASVAGGMVSLANNGVNTDPATGQYVSLSADILHTPNFTLETWFTFNGGNPWQRLLDLGNSVPDPIYGMIGQGFIILTLNGGYNPLGQISLNSWGDPIDTDYTVGFAPFPVGGEHSLVYVHSYDLRSEEIWLDGSLIGSSYADVNPALANYSNFYMGRSQFSQDPFYNGSIDEMRTYDGALTSDQIIASYQAGPDTVVIPEPATLTLLGLGTVGLFTLRRRIR